MAARKPPKKSRKSTQHERLGPVGADVEVTFAPHALGRLIEHYTPYNDDFEPKRAPDFERQTHLERQRDFNAACDAGLPYDEIVSGIKNPNAGESDAISERDWQKRGNTRYCRWFCPPAFGRRVNCQVVFVVDRPATDTDAGRIHIITIYPPKFR